VEVEGAFDPTLLASIEDAGINASAPREQRWIDGWLVRFSPGKAKRARCIQAVAAGRLPLADKLSRCLPIYAAAGLRPYVRITPFSEPIGLDGQLAALRWERIDDTRVMVSTSADIASGHVLPEGCRFEPVSGKVFTEWVGTARGSSMGERRAHGERVAASPVPYRAWLVRDEGGAAVAGGQVAVEAGLAGLYDVFSIESQRGRGLATALCGALLAHAREEGATVAYLQVDADNEAARRVYRRLGFADAYAYHYRAPCA
jgi:GNAT superfamily N-acetyltransferase